MQNEYIIQIGTDLNTAQAQQQLRNFVAESSRTTRVNLGFDGVETFRTVTKYVDDLGQSFRAIKYSGLDEVTNQLVTLQERVVSAKTNFDQLNKTLQVTSKQTENYTNANGVLTTRITEVNSDGHELITTIETLQDEYGNVIQTTDKYNNSLGVMTSQHTEMKQVANQFSTEVQRTSDAMGNVITSTREWDNVGKDMLTTTTQMIDEEGNLVAITQKRNQATNTLLTTETKVLQTAQERLANTSKETTKTVEMVANQRQYVTTLEEVDKTGRRVVTQTREYADAQGYSVKETQKFVRTQQGLVELEGKHIERLQIEAQHTAKQTTQTKALYKGYKALVTTTEEMTANGQILTTTTREYTNAQGYAVKEIVKFDQATGRVISSTSEMNKALGHVGQTFSDIIVKVTKFYVASLPIRTVQLIINQATTSVKEFDEAFTELAKVSKLSKDELVDYADKLADIGQRVGRTKTELVQTATELTKAGYDSEDVKVLSELVTLYQNTADEVLSASDATSVLVSQMKAFNYTARDAEHITDAINKVSADFAISSGDIGRGLTQAGAALSTYGNSFDETVGLITAGTEIFQGKSQQVARGLNTIASRIVKNEKALNDYGVTTRDVNGDILSTYQILTNLSPKWQTMTNEQKVSLGTTLAGY